MRPIAAVGWVRPSIALGYRHQSFRLRRLHPTDAAEALHQPFRRAWCRGAGSCGARALKQSATALVGLTLVGCTATVASEPPVTAVIGEGVTPGHGV
jgi:hypothetical protein